MLDVSCACCDMCMNGSALMQLTTSALTQAMQPRLTRAEGTYGIVIAPTRELCIQITDVLGLILRRFIWLVSNPHVA